MYRIIAVADADQEIVETSESNNTRFHTVQVGSDLVVSAFSGPSTAGAGTSIAVNDTTANQGSGQASASATHFYLSTNFTLDAQDVALGSRPVPTLGSGANDSGTTSLTIPAATVSGNYYLIAQADGGQTVSETSETNNTRSWNVKVGADLVVSALSGPSSGAPGVPITVSDTTKNQGTSAAGVSTTRYFLSTNIVLDAGDTVLGERAVGALGPGVSDAGSVTLTIPTGVGTGTLFLIAQADADDTVVETADSNNTKFRTIQIGAADLSVPLALGPFTAAAGASITITDTTKNGAGGLAGASTTVLYFSSNVFLDAGDPQVGSRAIPPLAGGASSQGTTQITVPSGLAPGFYYVIVQADALNQVEETLETNNRRLKLVRVVP